MNTIPDLLWQRAWRLASHHNHEWTIALHDVTGGGCTPPVPLSAPMLGVLLAQWRDEHSCSSFGLGVGSPFNREWVEGRWVATGDHNCWHWGYWRHTAQHRTGTGRCRWVIDHDGVVTISISRPGDVDVLTVVVAVDGAVHWTEHEGAPRYGERHVEAAVRELVALGVDASVPPRIAEAAAFADGELAELAVSLAQIDHWEDRAEQARVES